MTTSLMRLFAVISGARALEWRATARFLFGGSTGTVVSGATSRRRAGSWDSSAAGRKEQTRATGTASEATSGTERGSSLPACEAEKGTERNPPR
ncbi:hypothetical protein Atai01_13960 [Amycolatopsis taiwanensis]|uniref:Uncharacterized protein n=1 Tax=Amycolatopsis taiwanensis TaxID=342230 RepID=A0A9W6VES8_9PSEU|nr:hypothetical protein Atai01_13960 [Amycolatopsis taiwanensis]